MAKIFRAPDEVKLPEMDFANYNHAEYMEAENKYKADLKAHLNSQGWKGKNVGETIKLPMADSYAEYMVLSMRPLRLIHLELGDAWNSEFAELLTAKKVNQMIDGAKSFEKWSKEYRENNG